MSFTTTALVGNRVLVTGTDFLGTEGKAVLDSSQWVAVNARKQHKQASKEFDTAVEEFFKPLTEAADKAHSATVPVAEAFRAGEPEAGYPALGEANDLLGPHPESSS